MDCSPPGSSVQGIFQARGLQWDAIAFVTALKSSATKEELGRLQSMGLLRVGHD